jgi:hypothetical protein
MYNSYSPTSRLLSTTTPGRPAPPFAEATQNAGRFTEFDPLFHQVAKGYEGFRVVAPVAFYFIKGPGLAEGTLNTRPWLAVKGVYVGRPNTYILYWLYLVLRQSNASCVMVRMGTFRLKSLAESVVMMAVVSKFWNVLLRL